MARIRSREAKDHSAESKRTGIHASDQAALREIGSIG